MRLKSALRRGVAAAVIAGIVVSSGIPAYAARWDIANGDITVKAGDAEGKNKVSQGETIDKDDTNTVITGESDKNTVNIDISKGDVDVTFDDLKIDVSGKKEGDGSDDSPVRESKAAVTVKGDHDAAIELDGDNELKSGGYNAGLEKNEHESKGTLTIKDDKGKDGSLTAEGGFGGAGIGGGASGGVHAYAASCGMAACFAALFFAPLGSTAFVIELSRYDRSVWRHAPFMLLACFVAFGLASIIGIGDVIPKVPLPALSWPVVGQCVVIAVACALVGTVYIQIIDGAQRLTKRISQNYYLWAALGGVLMAVLVTLFDWRGFEGTGANLLSDALAGRAGGWTFAVKALLTIVCLGLWLRGGEIMPTFTVGALLGASCTVMTQGDPAFSAAVGLVAFFAAMSRCPVTAFLMGCEIFGWAAAPAFALAVAVSFSLGRDVGLYGRGATGILKRATSAARARLVVKKP